MNLLFRLLAWLHAFRLMLSHRKPRRRFTVITPEQLETLQAMVGQLVADNADADAKTTDSHQRDGEATMAAAAAAQAKLDKVTADVVVAADVSNLQAFVATLVVPAAPPAE